MIAEERLLKIIKKPLVSEKTHMLAEKSNTIVFSVAKDSNKREIKRAVETLFNVEVESVNTLNQKGKAKRTGMRQGRRSDVKKAYVTLVEGQDLDFTGDIE